MAATPTATFDDIFIEQRAPARAPEPEGRGHWFGSWEEWLSLTLILLVQIPVVGSLQSANWVDEMPSLMSAGVLGVLTGWVLAQSRLRALVATVAGVVLAFAIVIGMVLHTMERFDYGLGEGFAGIFKEFLVRLRDWGAAFLDGGISADPLPFVVLLVALVFAVGYLTSWSVVRWRNPWVALVPGGVVLLTNISYLPGQPSLAFVIFLGAAVLLVTRLHYMKSASRWEESRVGAPLGMSAEVLGAGAIIGVLLIVLAWTVPTANNWGPVSDAWMRVTSPVRDQLDGLGQLFIGVRSKQPIPVHAFGDTMPLQGSVTLNAGVLFEVAAEQPGLLRGAVYDEYTGNGWRLSSSGSTPLDPGTVEAAQFGTVETRIMLRQPVVAEVSVVGERAPGSMLLTPGEPLAADVEGEFVLGPTSEAVGISPSSGSGTGDTYTTVGSVSAAAADSLRSAGTDYPATMYGVYTALPGGLPAEVHTLAQTIVGDAATPYDAARRIEEYLRSNYTFALDAPRPTPRQDAVARFLFEDGAGHFDHFASAMTVMLRTVGIPSRVSVGFVLEERDLNPDTGLFELTEEDAWAWPEVYFPGYGWVEFNPTPARGAFQRPGDDSQLQRERDALADRDFNDPLMDEYYLDLLGWEMELMGDGGVGGGSVNAIEADEGSGPWLRILSVLMIVSVVLFALILGVRFLWERRFRGLSPAVRRWGKVQRLAHWAGVSPETWRTPVEGADDLAVALGPAAAPPLRSLAIAYTRARYGPPEAHGDESETDRREADREYRVVSRQLWGLVARRLIRFGRVPDRMLARRGALVGRRTG